MIKIDIKPLSVNKSWKGRRFKTSAYKRYRIDCLYLLPQKKIGPPPYWIYLEFGLSNMGGDFDNPIKPFIDILSEKYGFNDNKIKGGTIVKVKVKKGKEYVKFNISPFKKSNWISVKDDLPKKEQQIIIFGKYGALICGYESHMWNDSDTTHWQPLPKPPNQ